MKRLSAFVCIILASCSPVLEATRPDPVDLSQFTIGENRLNVLAEIGSPISTTKNRDNSCDIYKLYTDGPSGGEKGAIAAGEALADIATLGLAELISTPAEAATRSNKHIVIFCYDRDNKLVGTNLAETPADN